MLDVYGTRVGGLIIYHCEILHLSGINKRVPFSNIEYIELATY
jgi:hypothetical protein